MIWVFHLDVVLVYCSESIEHVELSWQWLTNISQLVYKCRIECIRVMNVSINAKSFNQYAHKCGEVWNSEFNWLFIRLCITICINSIPPQHNIHPFLKHL